MQEQIVVGQMLKAQGIKGEIKVKPICDDPARFFELKRVNVEGASMRVLGCRMAGGFVYLYLDKLVTRTQAEEAAGKFLSIDREDVVLEEGRYLICDLLGCDVVFSDGEKLGILEDVLQTYAIDTYVVRTEKGRVLFPAVAKAVESIEPENGKIVLNRAGFSEVSCYED